MRKRKRANDQLVVNVDIIDPRVSVFYYGATTFDESIISTSCTSVRSTIVSLYYAFSYTWLVLYEQMVNDLSKKKKILEQAHRLLYQKRHGWSHRDISKLSVSSTTTLKVRKVPVSHVRNASDARANLEWAFAAAPGHRTATVVEQCKSLSTQLRIVPTQ